MSTNPLFRPFIHIHTKALSPSSFAERDSNNAATFTVMTYNMLAQCLAKSDLFPFLKKGGPILKRKNRHAKFLAEFQHYQPDIACLQEVDETFTADFGQALDGLDYHVVYEKRKVGHHGLCTMWKKSKYTQEM
jgi:RNA exonuclease NGL2